MDRDPPRLRDDLSPEGALRRSLLVEGDDFSPSEEELSKLEVRLGPLLAPPTGSAPQGAPPQGGPPPPSAPPIVEPFTSGVASALAKAALVALTTVAVSGAGLLLWTGLGGSGHDEDRPVERSRASAPAEPAATAPRPDDASLASAPPRATDGPALAPEPAAPLESPSPRRQGPAWAAAARPSAEATHPTTALAAQPPSSAERAAASEAEIAILQRAHRALREGQFARALALVADHERSGGALLAQERERIAIEALIRLGRTEEARARARRFERQFPGSSHGPRIRALLGGAP